MQARNIKDELNALIREAASVDPSLAKRLDEIIRWIKDIKDGSLVAKRFVIIFLLQIVKDSKAWLLVKALPSQEEQQAYFDQLTPTLKYWYSYLFPKWLSENDPKFYIWRQKIMAGEFTQEDENLLEYITNNIELRQGSVVRRYIADLSMATDIIVSSRQEKPLCIQLTTLSDAYSQEKYDNWVNTLRAWEIDRGVFLNYNPGKLEVLNQLVNRVLFYSDNLPLETYLKISL